MSENKNGNKTQKSMRSPSITTAPVSACSRDPATQVSDWAESIYRSTGCVEVRGSGGLLRLCEAEMLSSGVVLRATAFFPKIPSP